MSGKEKQFTVRMDEETYDWLIKKAADISDVAGKDVTRSDLLRVSALLAVPLIEDMPDLLNRQLKDKRKH